MQRLKRIVDDVLAVTPTDVANPLPVDVGALVGTVVQEWNDGPGRGRAQVQVGERLPAAQFDAEHLRRVLVNLLDNAGRHATDAQGAVRIDAVHEPSEGVVITVGSDGPPIAPDVERHLFEPFFSTRSRGTGLGLYICRELCERHGATIDFRPGRQDERHCNQFRVAMRVARPA